MSNVVYLCNRYPNKEWPIEFLAHEVARLLQEGEQEKGEDLIKGLPHQLLEGHFFAEVTRQGAFLEG